MMMFAKTRAQNPDKERALGRDYAGEDNLKTTVIKACRGIPELEIAFFKPA